MANENAWAALEPHGERLRTQHLRALFDADPRRFDKFSFRLDDLFIDLSKEKIDAEALNALIALARETGVEARRDAMATGEAINETEGRAVLHMALRGSVPPPDGDDVQGVLDRFLGFAEDVRGGVFSGSGGAFTDVLNIGIGGSDLGPAMAARALHADIDGPRPHFVSNVDGAHFADTVARLDPRTTLVVICSKTFTTQETMANARLARAWLGTANSSQLAAVSTNLEGCAGFGIPEERVFGFWDWVGGRYSMWSAIGLSLAVAIGRDRFKAMLDGAKAMDQHFLTAPLAENLPILLGLIGIWRRNVLGYGATALIPYDQRLDRFAAHIQQVDMESNGKSVALDGMDLDHASGPVIFGEPGTNAQHSFFQLLHQGSDVIPVDFIASASPNGGDPDHHQLLLANCLAQAQALAFGRTEDETAAEMRAKGISESEVAEKTPHRTFPGDRPSTMILQHQMTPYALGRLVALFEHRVFVQGAIWGVNSFDQWGVELGKALTGPIHDALSGEDIKTDQSTQGLIGLIRGQHG
ncbi:MAG: glucose-6-phosphate isomerase [Pseudomonadota bacterium]